MPYFAISNLVAAEFPDSTSIDVLQASHEYLLERSSPIQDNGANYHYDFNLIHGYQINKSGWIISRVYTFCAFNPSEIVFCIIDPCGMSDSDVDIYVKGQRGSQTFISFPGLGLQTLNQGLQLLELLSGYKNWYHFLLSPGHANFSTRMLIDLRKAVDENARFIRKISRLREIINELD